jgi:hypothetical protein
VSSASVPPLFGVRVAGARYVIRPCVYGVLERAPGEVAIVATPLGHFLPGGGLESGETEEQGLVREIREECGLRVCVGERLGEAIQLDYAAAARMQLAREPRVAAAQPGVARRVCGPARTGPRARE